MEKHNKKLLVDLALKKLKEKYPNARYIPMPSYSDGSANGLTKCVIDWINLNNGFSERISTTGRPIDERKEVVDCLGNKRTIGSIKWIKSNQTKGSADVSSTILGRSVKWEVKMKDKQSEDQKKYQENTENAGGFYFIVRNFDEFINIYNQLLINFK